MLVNEPLKEQKIALKRYLGKYYRARNKKAILINRRESLKNEIEMPISGIKYCQIPRSITNSISDGAASIPLIISEIESRIKEQTDNMAIAMLNIMDIMELLPEDSMEREIMEYRHIDCMPWKIICDAAHMARSSCNEYYNKGLELLLKNPNIIIKLEEFIKEESQIHCEENSGHNRTS